MEKDSSQKPEKDTAGFASSSLGEWQRAPHTVPTSIVVIEGFFGEGIHDGTAEKIRKLPLKQANELIERLYDHIRETLAAFGNRNGEGRDPSPAYQYLQTGEIHANDEVVLRSSASPDIASASVLKHLALYCDRAVVWDPLMIPQAGFNGPRPPKQWIPLLAHGVNQLLPIADLVRSGYFVLARTTPLEMSHSFNGLFLSKDTSSDPYNTYLIRHAINKNKRLASAVFTALERQRMFHNTDELEYAGPYLADELAKRYPQTIDQRWLRRIVAYTSETHRYHFTPIITDPLVKFHIEQGNRILLGEEPLKKTPKSRALESLMRFHIPELSSVSYDDIHHLRRDEAVFAQLRSALDELAKECSQASGLDTAANYRDFLYESGQDIVGPAFDKLRQLHRRARAKSIIGKASFKALTFGLDNFLDVASKAIEEGGNPIVGKKSARRMKNIKIANGILKTISRQA